MGRHIFRHALLALLLGCVAASGWAKDDPPCPQITVDFETEDDFATPLVNGQDITTPPEFGNLISISSSGNNLGAAIFDTSFGGDNDPGPDPDLIVGLGNSLILQSNDSPTQTVPGIFDTPNDSARGGNLTFDFLVRAELYSVDLIDICPINSAIVTLVDASGLERVYDVPFGWTTDISGQGPPGYGTLDLTTLDPQPGFQAPATATEDPGFDPTNVVQLDVFFSGSAAVDTLVFCEVCPEESIALSPNGTSGDVGDTHTVTATVTDENNDPVAGREVTFTILPGSANFPGGGTDTTDANGEATFTYLGEEVGEDTIEATFVNPCTGDTVKSNRVKHEWDCPVETLTLAPETSTGPTGTIHTVTATLLDGDSNPIEGRTVEFMTLPGSANTASGSDVTDASGEATFSYVGDNLGTDMIEATTLDCAGDEVKSNVVERVWECPEEAISLAPETSEGPIGTMHTVTATLTRTDTGDPLEGRTVMFMTLPGSANDASGSAVSDANGMASFSYVGANAGVDSIQASFTDCASANVVSNVVERVWDCPIETISLAPASSEGPVGTMHTVTATVLDDGGAPIEGRTVMFMTLPGSANAASGSDMTDAAGQATFTYTGEAEGTDFIQASFSDCAGEEIISNTVEREWSCPVETIMLSIDPPMPTVGMEVKVVAIVMTEGGDPVEGRPVTFEFLPGSISMGGPFVIDTNANGKAKLIYTQDEVGQDFIRATTLDCNENELIAEGEILWAECFLWIGKKTDFNPLSPPDQDIMLVKNLKLTAPVLEDDIPVLRVPNRPRLIGRHVYAQIYLSNPTIFPEDPVQTSNGLDITLGVDEIPVPYGPEFGIDLWAEMPALLGEDFTILFDVRGM